MEIYLDNFEKSEFKWNNQATEIKSNLEKVDLDEEIISKEKLKTVVNLHLIFKKKALFVALYEKNKFKNYGFSVIFFQTVMISLYK